MTMHAKLPAPLVGPANDFQPVYPVPRIAVSALPDESWLQVQMLWREDSPDIFSPSAGVELRLAWRADALLIQAVAPRILSGRAGDLPLQQLELFVCPARGQGLVRHIVIPVVSGALPAAFRYLHDGVEQPKPAGIALKLHDDGQQCRCVAQLSGQGMGLDLTTGTEAAFQFYALYHGEAGKALLLLHPETQSHKNPRALAVLRFVEAAVCPVAVLTEPAVLMPAMQSVVTVFVSPGLGGKRLRALAGEQLLGEAEVALAPAASAAVCELPVSGVPADAASVRIVCDNDTIGTVPVDAGSGREAEDLRILRRRLIENQVSQYQLTADPQLERLLAELSAAGSWPDIDYADLRTANWDGLQHWSRLLELATAWLHPDSALHRRADVRDACVAAFGYWARQDFIHPASWFYNVIGIPLWLSRVTLLIDAALPTALRRYARARLARTSVGRTGQNRVWQANVVARRAILENNFPLAAMACAEIAATITDQQAEGIQADRSFHQHGRCLFNFGYGQSFMQDCAEFAELVYGTGLALPAAKVRLLVDYLLDGQQWMMRSGCCDFGTIGRTLARPPALQVGAGLVRVARQLLSVATERRDEIEALLAALQGQGECPPITGSRHFWRSELFCHHGNGWYASARTYSTRLYNTDMPCCQEGLRSHHIADGCTVIMRHGLEYAEIFPVWDWWRVPGTTVALTAELPETLRRWGETEFAGGACDADSGVMAVDFHRDGLQARKGWFFFDSFFVCLGAGISLDRPLPVVTNINQCRLRGTVTAGFAAGPDQILPPGEHKLASVRWVHHDDVLYFFPNPQAVDLRIGPRQGSWYSINHNCRNEQVVTDVFLLGLEHGIAPVAASYAYVVAPAVVQQQVATVLDQLQRLTIVNTSQLQAVAPADGNRLQVVYYEAGSASLDNWPEVQAAQPCALVLARCDHAYSLAIADPAQQAAELTLLIGAALAGDAAQPQGSRTRLTLTMGQGADAGRSRTAQLHY